MRPADATTRNKTRRQFLQAAGAAGTLLATRGLRAADPAGKKTLLILGGTRFLGPAVVDAAKKSGWTITLFNRGKTNPGLFPDLEKLQGDRNNDLKSLEGRKWDAVVDTSGYYPREVRESATLLKDSKQYVFISSISVLKDMSKPGTDETAPVATTPDETVEKVTNETYGALKALCEKAAETAMPGRVANIRPGLIVGPDDGTDRFTYWPVRVSRGGEVLAPNTPADPVQFIDVRDLGDWIVRVLDNKTMGVFHATGNPQKIGGLLDTCKAVSGGDARFTWVDAAFLKEQKVSEWADMPTWISPIGEEAGGNLVSNARALAKGLTFRPLKVTVKDTLDWWKKEPAERQAKLRAGIKPEREAEVLKGWHEAQAAKDKKDAKAPS